VSSTDKPFGVPGTGDGDTDAAPVSEEEEIEAARTANRFDVRRLIGALFCLYGVILVALGAFGSHTVKNKADGINIDLWTGLAMIVFGVLMVVWALARPVMPEPPEARGQGSGRLRRAPAT
jgi:hypothetical protein